MDQQEGLAAIIAPLFTGNNYALWIVRIKCDLMTLGCNIWIYVERGYKIPDNLPTDRDGKERCESNAKALNTILNGLRNSIFGMTQNILLWKI